MAIITASIDEKTHEEVKEFLKNSKYRNRSHLVEVALKDFIKKQKVNKDGI